MLRKAARTACQDQEDKISSCRWHGIPTHTHTRTARMQQRLCDCEWQRGLRANAPISKYKTRWWYHTMRAANANDRRRTWEQMPFIAKWVRATLDRSFPCISTTDTNNVVSPRATTSVTATIIVWCKWQHHPMRSVEAGNCLVEPVQRRGQLLPGSYASWM